MFVVYNWLYQELARPPQHCKTISSILIFDPFSQLANTGHCLDNLFVRNDCFKQLLMHNLVHGPLFSRATGTKVCKTSLDSTSSIEYHPIFTLLLIFEAHRRHLNISTLSPTSCFVFVLSTERQEFSPYLLILATECRYGQQLSHALPSHSGKTTPFLFFPFNCSRRVFPPKHVYVTLHTIEMSVNNGTDSNAPANGARYVRAFCCPTRSAF
jgi:hypothetical protein